MKYGLGQKILTFLLVILIACYMGIQIYRSNNTDLRTESALTYTAYDDIVTDGLFIRREQVIYSENTGYRSYYLADGSKVAKGGVVAEIYQDENTANAKAGAADLEEKIEQLELLTAQKIDQSTDLNIIDKQLSNRFISLLDEVGKGDFMDAESTRNEILNLLNKQQIVTGEVSSFDDLIASLQAEKDSLLAEYSEQPEQITTETSGYFVKEADGYEDQLDVDQISTLTPKQITEFQEDAVLNDSNIIGKLVKDYEWYIACVVSFEDSMNFHKGQTVTLDLSLSSMDKMSAAVESVNKPGKDKEAVVVFRCTNMNGDLAKIRKKQISIVLKSYSGLRINSGAVRFVDGQKGVYLVEGAEVKFCPIETLYTGDGYVICKEAGLGETGLELYDEIVVEGKNLYDGKVVK